MTLAVASIGAGPDLVLLHGWGMHRGVWAGVTRALAARFRVHAVDLPGHGESRAPWPANVDAVVAMLVARFPGTVHLAGWSLGALVALAWAAAHAHRVASLVLISATPSFAARADWPHGWSAAVLDAFCAGLAADPDATRARFATLATLGAPGARATAASLRALLERAPAPRPQALREAFAALRDTDLRPRLDAVRAPALALHGEGDRVVPVAAGERLAAALPDARFETIAAAAHAPLVSHADRVAERIEAFHERS